MVAQSIGCGPIEALCLAEGGERKGKMMPATGYCDGYKNNYFGAVDEPPDYGESVRAEYVKAEGPNATEANR